MSERGPDPVASAMAGAILGVEEELAEATEVYGNMYAEAYWRAFDDLKGRVGSNAAAALGEDFQVLFHVFAKRAIERRVGVTEVNDSPQMAAAGTRGRAGGNVPGLECHRQ